MSSLTRSPLSKQSSPSLFIPNPDSYNSGASTTMRCQLVPLTILGFRGIPRSAANLSGMWRRRARNSGEFVSSLAEGNTVAMHRRRCALSGSARWTGLEWRSEWLLISQTHTRVHTRSCFHSLSRTDPDSRRADNPWPSTVRTLPTESKTTLKSIYWSRDS